MTNMMQDAAAWLGSRLQEQAGRSVIYSRGGTKITTTGVLRERMYRSASKAGLFTQTKAYDWLLPSADLTITPRRGDKITSGGVTYEVLPIDDLPVWEYHDNANETTVIHTKRVA